MRRLHVNKNSCSNPQIRFLPTNGKPSWALNFKTTNNKTTTNNNVKTARIAV